MIWTKWLYSALAALAFAQGCTAGEVQSGGPSARQAVAQGATLLDVRTPEEFAAGHLDGAVLIPVSELPNRMGELPRDRPVVVYCHSGRRSAAAAEQLRATGFQVQDIGAMSNY